jgi:hypothetical protein
MHLHKACPIALKEPELVPAIILRKMLPGIREILMDVAFMEGRQSMRH